MLTKILITIAIIASVVLYSRHKRGTVEPETPELPENRLLKRLAPLFGLLLMAAAVVWFGYDWYQGQQVMKVTVTAADGVVSEYLVKRSELNGRTLVTVDGLSVQLSKLDRVVVSPN